jgi:hypothetical protein
MKEEEGNQIVDSQAAPLHQLHLDTNHSSPQLQIMEVEKGLLWTTHQAVGIIIQFQAIHCIYRAMELISQTTVNMVYDLEVESLPHLLFRLPLQQQLLQFLAHTHHPLQYHPQPMVQHHHQQAMIIQFQQILFNIQILLRQQ